MFKILLPSPTRSSLYHRKRMFGSKLKYETNKRKTPVAQRVGGLFGWRILYFGNFFLPVTFWNFDLQLRFGLIWIVTFIHALARYLPETLTLNSNQQNFSNNRSMGCARVFSVNRTSKTSKTFKSLKTFDSKIPKIVTSLCLLPWKARLCLLSGSALNWRLWCWKSLIEIVKPPEDVGYVFCFVFF